MDITDRVDQENVDVGGSEEEELENPADSFESQERLSEPKEVERKKKSSSDLLARLYNYKQSIGHKLEVLKQRQESTEMVECTFKPKINGSKRCRSWDEFISDMHKRPLRFEKAEEPLSFRPSICEKSVKLLPKNRGNESVFINLYKGGPKAPLDNPDLEKCTFMPINRKPLP